MNTASEFMGKESIFAQRLTKLMENGGVTQQKLAAAIGTTRQAVAQYADGLVLPNIEKLYKMAKFFNVSADYLLGISDIQTQDNEIRDIHTTLGLSEQAIDTLIDLNYKNCDFKPISEDDKFDAYCSDNFIDLYSYFMEDLNCYDVFLGIIRFCNVCVNLYQVEKLKDKLKPLTQGSFTKPELNEIFNGVSLDPDGTISLTVTPEEAKFAILNNITEDFKAFVEKYADRKIKEYQTEMKKLAQRDDE